jgi:hypothetical protein
VVIFVAAKVRLLRVLLYNDFTNYSHLGIPQPPLAKAPGGFIPLITIIYSANPCFYSFSG